MQEVSHTLTDSERTRYNRQIIAFDNDEAKQIQLKNAKVGIIGCGALGSMCAMQLAGAGIGKIIIADFDTVSISNLHRQLFFTTYDENVSKGDVLKKRMEMLNPEIEVEFLNLKVRESEASRIAKLCDVILEGSDNADTKYMMESVCEQSGIPFIIAGVNGFCGQVMTCVPGSTKFSDIFPPINSQSTPPGVISSAPVVAAGIMTSEAIKLITNTGTPLINRLLTFNLLTASFKTHSILP